MYGCLCSVCTWYLWKLEKDIRFLWDWSYRWLSADMWLLGTKPYSSTRVASTLNCCIISPAPMGYFFSIYFIHNLFSLISVRHCITNPQSSILIFSLLLNPWSSIVSKMPINNNRTYHIIPIQNKR